VFWTGEEIEMIVKRLEFRFMEDIQGRGFDRIALRIGWESLDEAGDPDKLTQRVIADFKRMENILDANVLSLGPIGKVPAVSETNRFKEATLTYSGHSYYSSDRRYWVVLSYSMEIRVMADRTLYGNPELTLSINGPRQETFWLAQKVLEQGNLSLGVEAERDYQRMKRLFQSSERITPDNLLMTR